MRISTNKKTKRRKCIEEKNINLIKQSLIITKPKLKKKLQKKEREMMQIEPIKHDIKTWGKKSKLH